MSILPTNTNIRMKTSGPESIINLTTQNDNFQKEIII